MTCRQSDEQQRLCFAVCVCVCCRCVTLSVLQVQNSSNLGQRHQCDVFERWRWSRLPQRTLKCVDHLVSLPCNLRTHTHTHTDCNIGSKREERKLVCPCVILNGAWVYFAVCGRSCHRLLGNKSMRPS